MYLDTLCNDERTDSICGAGALDELRKIREKMLSGVGGQCEVVESLSREERWEMWERWEERGKQEEGRT